MSVFADDWRACLREQYKTTIRDNDHSTRESLKDVMYQTGFTDDDLRQLVLEATMHIDDAPDDFTPDLDRLQASTPEPAPATDTPGFQPHPLECQCPSCMEQALTPHDEEGQPIPTEDIDPERPPDDTDADAPQQLTLF